MARDPEIAAHLEWMGYVQPVGLVVSPTALAAAQAHVNRNIVPEHRAFLDQVTELSPGGGADAVPGVADLPGLLAGAFGWRPGDLVSGAPLDALEVSLPAYGETLRPDFAVPEPDPADGAGPWQMLVQAHPPSCDFDAPPRLDDRRWGASPQARFERLLRETRIPAGLLFNTTHLRLVYAPVGETSGYMDFPVDAMAKVDGRPVFAGLHLLLSAERLFTLPRKQRLPQLLAESRKYQNLVSTQLSRQVLESLYELLHGFQAADDQSRGELLRDVLREDPNHVYAGLLNVLLRLVFVLYAEDRGLLPNDPVYTGFYSVNGLFERLRADASRFPDTMDQRHGAWAQLLALFRLIHDGARHGATFRLPPRHGHLFNPDRYPFLEGRAWLSARQAGLTVQPPMVSDGVVFRVLQNLLILDGERLSYRTLDVEQIGSVYETVMGFTLEVARGRSIAVRPVKPHGAPVTVNLEALLAEKPGSRAKWVKDTADQAVTGESLQALQAARTPEDLVAALGKKVSPTTPRIVPPGAMILQPSDERRRSGSHYTPRSLTEPIVRTTLRPVLEQLGDKPTPEQILDLKVCDPAMGSGAFLVEACRQLADELVRAWHAHGSLPEIPPDEDEVLFARRLVARRCLYGVDKNPMAVDLAKLALWLATLARDHAFTFVDHALKCGDSLVGLSRRQIAAFHWRPTAYIGEIEPLITERLRRALDLRAQIHRAGEAVNETSLRLLLKESQEALDGVRTLGDLVVAAFFAGEKPKDRENARSEALAALTHAWAHPDLPEGPSAPPPRHCEPQTAVGGDVIVERPASPGNANLPIGLPKRANQEIGVPRGGGDPGNTRTFLAAERSNPPLQHPPMPTPELPPDLAPFHWEIEFPEVFHRENPGFDAFVGNPPFQGGRNLTAAMGQSYADFLVELIPESSGAADLVARFFRKCFDLLRQQGAFGLIATNTIGQGDTRATGLQWICTHGGTVFNARKRYKWPGQAAVVVSVVHISKGTLEGPFLLDDKPVPAITAFLFHAGGHESPATLTANAGKSFQGSIVLGMGFTFDDTDTKGIATPIAEMNRLIEKDARNAEVIFPYIGGEEVNTSPTQAHHRYVVNFGERSEHECRQSWPDLMRIVEEKVKPERIIKDARKYPRMVEEWWKYWNARYELYATIRGKERVLAINCGATPHAAFAMLSSRIVFANTLAVVSLDSCAAYAVLQSRPHEIWARFFGSSMKDDLRYTPSDCFETFPFPKGFETDPSLESAGQAYYAYRAALMVRNNEGLTKTYNRFHDPEEGSAEIQRLRELHAAMDRAVLDAYGWTDLRPTCEFLLDYEEEDDDGEVPARGRGRKKPWRYRWPDDLRDEVLARLLELNRQYAEEERLSGAAAEKKGKKKGGTTKTAKTAKKKEEKKREDDDEMLF